MVATIVIIYLLVVLAIGFYMRSRIKNETDFLAAGGKLGAVVGGATLAATQMSGGTAIGTVGFHYQVGYNFAWIWIAIWASWTIMTLLIAPKMKAFFNSHKALTIPDLLGTRFESNRVRVIAVIILLVCFGMTIVAELVGGSYLLNVVFGLSKTAGVLIIAAVFIAYTVAGGLFAIAYTDLLQMAIFVVGFAIAIPFAVGKAGGFAELNAKLASIDPGLIGNGMPPNTLMAVALSFFIMMIGYPIIAVRFFSIKDNKTIRRAVGYSLIFQAIIAVSVSILGVSARVLYPHLQSPDLASPTIAMNLLPPVLGGLLLAAILAAIQSTVSAVLLMLGSAISHDILKKVMKKEMTDKQQVKITRIVVLIMGILPIPFALNPLPLIQQIWINAAALIGSSFAVVTLLGLYWKRGTTAGAVCSMVGGIGSAIIWLVLGNPFGLDAVYISMPVSLLGMVLVSLVTKPVSKEALAPFFKDEQINISDNQTIVS
ncbi:sodium:solute symporter family protein [Aneurinibacillus tyrosinisolvens]|uniref:sodium:solute symporter family protein n=1 Tax=Aneurinibacillus tyrosinisolvens TaxID=1443435 RepID=UPI00063F4806|nr:sodium/solute symporter [Aneurinibacillus tyrosinisolvens]